jgi:ribosomal protein S20
MMTDVTHILNAIERGDAGAANQLLSLVYEELSLLKQKGIANKLAWTYESRR